MMQHTEEDSPPKTLTLTIHPPIQLLPNNLVEFLLYANGKRLTKLTSSTKILEVHIGDDSDESLMTDDGITLLPNAFEIVNGKEKGDKHLLKIPDTHDRDSVYSKWLSALRGSICTCILLSSLNTPAISVEGIKISIAKCVTLHKMVDDDTLKFAYSVLKYLRRVEELEEFIKRKDPGGHTRIYCKIERLESLMSEAHSYLDKTSLRSFKPYMYLKEYFEGSGGDLVKAGELVRGTEDLKR